eukprot:763811-Hanusia_phi.AAC.10
MKDEWVGGVAVLTSKCSDRNLSMAMAMVKSGIVWRSLLLCVLSRPSHSFLTTKVITRQWPVFSHNSNKRLETSCALAQNDANAAKKIRSTYRALWANKAGESFREVALLKEQKVPQICSDEVLIEVKYAGVNGGCETFRARGEHWFARNRESADGFPLGAEGVGKVVEIGKDVMGIEVGEYVAFVGGAFSEYVVHKSGSLVKVPEATPEAVACRISGLTAYGAVLDAGRAKARQTVLITAAAGAAGSFAVQLAKQAGCTVIGTCSSKEKALALCKLGCDHIINYRTRNVDEVRFSQPKAGEQGYDRVQVLRSKFPEGVDLVIEHVGGQMFRTAFSHLKPGGRLVLVGYISEWRQYPHNQNSGEERKLTEDFDLPSIFWKVLHTGKGAKALLPSSYHILKQVFEQLSANSLKVLIDTKKFHGLESVADAVDHMLSGNTIGKVVVKIS